MIDGVASRLYERLGRRYRFVFLAAELLSGLGVAVVATIVLTSFYKPSAGKLAVMAGAACFTTAWAVVWAVWRGGPHIARVFAWLDEREPTAELTVQAWDAATNYTMRSFRANFAWVALIAAGPLNVVIALELRVSAAGVLALIGATVLPLAYGTMLNYVVSEAAMRPVIADIATRLPDDFPFEANGLLIRKRLKLLLPTFTAYVGLLVGALLADGGGTPKLAETLAAAVVIGLLFSFELTVLLAQSVTGPISLLRRGLERVRAGDYDARVRVVTSDELGELSHDFNLMAAGLAERERIREAFHTYLDADVAPLILSGRYPREGISVLVTVMFVDVRGFTSFAERAEPAEVVATLNGLFEVTVPIVAEHGGHVDKFMGDGMLAVFGAPEGYPDHADRAVAAGEAIVRAVNRPESPLAVGVGINTGRVVAGSIGGAGRLNFSVIGDAVNVAARVEAATRATGDDVLLTRATCNALTRSRACHSRGSVELKGKADPVEVLALEPAPARVSSLTK